MMYNLRSHFPDSPLAYHQQVELYEIAHELKQAGLSEKFIVDGIRTASEFEGVAELLHLWKIEPVESERAEATGIPQPSLSRFFNSNAIPRRTTLLKIGKALHLDAVQIAMPWSY